jgi:hypothetical protein
MGSAGIIGPCHRCVGRNTQCDWLHCRGRGHKGRGAHAERAGGTVSTTATSSSATTSTTAASARGVTASTAGHDADQQNQSTKQTRNHSHSPSSFLKLGRLTLSGLHMSADVARIVKMGPYTANAKLHTAKAWRLSASATRLRVSVLTFD